jgi:hypothetical protein
MRLRLVLVAVLAVLFVPAARAQFAVYGNLNLTRFDDQANRTSTWFYGPGGGIYDDFLPLGPLALGLDVRGSYGWGDGYAYRDGLAGLRLVARPPVLPIRPYVEGAVGLAATRATATTGLPTHFSNKFAYEVLGGLDLTIFPHIDLRIPEIGYGQVSPVAGPNAPATTLFQISTGVVIRFW